MECIQSCALDGESLDVPVPETEQARRAPCLFHRLRDSRLPPSLTWRKITLLRAHMIPPVQTVQINCPERPVRLEIRRRIRQQILASQFFRDAVEAVDHILHRRREKRPSARRLGHLAQRVVTASAAWSPVRADRVDDRLRSLAHLDRLVDIDAALVVVPVRDHHNRAPHRFLSARLR